MLEMNSKTKSSIERTLKRVLIDVDSKPNLKFFKELAEKVALIEKYMPVEFKLQKIVSTKKGLHIYFDIEPMYEVTPYDIIIYQLILGSDWRRELFNMRRAKDWWENDGLKGLSPQWNTLYQYKFEGKKLESYEYESNYTKLAQSIFLEYVEKYRKEFGKFKCKKGGD